MNSPEVRAPPAARLARLVFGRRTSSRRRLPRPNAEPFPSKPPSAARRRLVDGVRTRERAVAGRLGAAPYAAPSTNVKTSPKSSRTSTNGFGFGFGFGDVFSGVGTVSVSRFLVGCSRAGQTSPRRPTSSFAPRTVLVSSSSRTSQRRASSLVTSFVAFFSRRRSSSYASYASSFFSSKNDESGDETSGGSVPRRGAETFLRAGAPATGFSRRSRWLTGTERGTASSTTGFWLCFASRPVLDPEPARPGIERRRDASAQPSHETRRALRSRRTELVPGRDDTQPAARRASRGGANLALDAAAVQVVLDHGSPGKSTFLRTQRRAGSRRIAAVRSAARGRVFFIFSRDVVSPRRRGRFGRRAPRTVRTRVL